METSAFGARRQVRRRDDEEFFSRTPTKDRAGNQRLSNFAVPSRQRVTSGKIVANKATVASAGVSLAELVNQSEIRSLSVLPNRHAAPLLVNRCGLLLAYSVAEKPNAGRHNFCPRAAVESASTRNEAKFKRDLAIEQQKNYTFTFRFCMVY
jgi:hypothetical protein